MTSSHPTVPRSSLPLPPHAYIFVCAEVTPANMIRQYYLRSDAKIQVCLLTRTEEKAMIEQQFDPLKLVRDPTAEELNLYHRKVVAALIDSAKLHNIMCVIYGQP